MIDTNIGICKIKEEVDIFQSDRHKYENFLGYSWTLSSDRHKHENS